MRQTAIIKVHLMYVSNSANHTENSVLPTKKQTVFSQQNKKHFSQNKTQTQFIYPNTQCPPDKTDAEMNVLLSC